VEVRTARGTLIVLDCGTGAHALGQELVETAKRPLRAHLLITHTHWDHIQGFPFFAPLFDPTTEWDIYAPGGLGKRLEETLAGQMEYTYFPVTLEQLGATVRYHDLVEGGFEIDDVYVLARYLNHPALTLGYRLQVGGASLVYAVDHEPHASHHTDVAPDAALPVHQEDRRHIEFLAGADLVIHDATYTLDEYADRVGWGHSPVEYAVDVSMAARARRLALFHHGMTRDDASLERLVLECRERVRARGGTLEVFAAAEGQVVDLAEREPRRAAGADDTARRIAVAGVGPKTVLIVDDAPDVVSLLTRTLQSEGYRLLSAEDGESALQIARAERPDLILLDWILPVRDGLEVCRSLRAERDPKLRDVPIVLITAQTEPEHVAAGFAAGATDYLTKPFKVAHVRSRVRGWLLRTAATNGSDPDPA
jgi:CheY-like chemotaxis protein/phosphoribosyl 1,2-cyclic phosphodiesterase